MTRLVRATIPAVSIAVTSSKIFTHPTRLADCWKPGIQEINIPAHEVTRSEIEVHIQEGSTRMLGIKKKQRLLRRLYNKFLVPIQIDDEYVYDARYETDENIAHVLDNVASAVFAVRNTFPKTTIVLRARASIMAKNAYALLRLPVICTDAEVIGKLIVLKEAGRDQFSGDGMYSSFFNDISFDGYERGTPDKVFISRRGARALLNEAEVEGLLVRYGYQKVYFEDIPLATQWSITRNAKEIVAIHGAALFSLVFSRSRPKVVELFHPGYVVDLYRNVTNAIGGTWCGVSGQLPGDIVQHLDYDGDPRYFQSHPTRIDITSLKLALETVGIG
jgi:hypothetical protein